MYYSCEPAFKFLVKYGCVKGLTIKGFYDFYKVEMGDLGCKNTKFTFVNINQNS